MTMLFEDMIRVQTPYYVCRIWRQSGGDQPYTSNEGLRDLAMQQLFAKLEPEELERIIVDLCDYEAVNSVEIVSREDGCGRCVHKNWP